MHEYGVTKALVELCNAEAEKNDIKTIKKITIKIGKFTGFSPDSIEFYFEYLKENTSCAHARIAFIDVPIRISCRSCSKESVIEEPLLVCPHCGKSDIAVKTGREFFVESIEGE